VFRDADGETIADLARNGERALIARGGKGGMGNLNFKSSTNRAPRQFTRGEQGQSRKLELELRVLADVGLLGMPNAGKSTLIRAVSAARPKVADYPFTTLQPNLGVVGLSDHRSFVMADIPGIIEGAHEGKGLGLRFLQHVERTRVIAVLVPLDSPDPQATYDLLMREATLYNGELGAKPHVVVLTKLDLRPPGDPLPALQPQGDAPVCAISAVTRAGLPELLETLWQTLRAGAATTSRPT
jgi:GTP-binding protein